MTRIATGPSTEFLRRQNKEPVTWITPHRLRFLDGDRLSSLYRLKPATAIATCASSTSQLPWSALLRPRRTLSPASVLTPLLRKAVLTQLACYPVAVNAASGPTK